METFSELLTLCAGNSPVTGEVPAKRTVTRVFDVIFHLRLYMRLSKQSWGWWFEMPSRPLSRHCNARISLEPINNFSDYRYIDIDRLESHNKSVIKQNLSQPCARYMKYTVYILLGSLQNMNKENSRRFFVIFILTRTMDAPLWGWSNELLVDQIPTYLTLMSVSPDTNNNLYRISI